MTKPATRLFNMSEMAFADYGGPPGKATIARLVGADLSTTMGAGIATFDGCSLAWTVLYDELIVGIAGLFRLRVGDEVFEAGPGDVIWIPEGTALNYEGDGATVFYALHPVHWKQKHGLG